MEDRPTPPPAAPWLDEPDPLDVHRAAGWVITPGLGAWTATLTRGNRVRVIAAHTPTELAAKLDTAAATDTTEGRQQ